MCLIKKTRLKLVRRVHHRLHVDTWGESDVATHISDRLGAINTKHMLIYLLFKHFHSTIQQDIYNPMFICNIFCYNVKYITLCILHVQ